jgi:hypothetical protein
MALADTLSTKLGGIPGQIQQKVRAGAEAQAGMESAVAEESKRLNAPIQEEKIREVGKQQQTISDVGKKMAQPIQIPQETVADFSQLGGLVAIAGVMLGTSGKMSAQNVLNSMTGIMDGYKKGRTDLIANYQKEFDMNQKRMQSQVQQAQAELSVILEKFKTRDQTVAQEIASFKAKYNAGIAATIADAQSADKIASTQIQLAQLSDRQTQATAKIDLDRANADKKNVLVNPTTGERGYMDSKTGKFVKLTMPDGFAPDQGGVDPLVTADGKPVYPDATGRYPTDKPLYKLSQLPKAGGTGGKGAVAGQVGRITGAMSQVSGAVQALSDLPVTTANPVFGQKNFSSLFTAPLSVLNQKMTDQTAFLMQTALAGVARNLATIETSGAATGLVGLTDKIEQAIIIQKGSTVNVALYKLAEMRRIVEDGVRTALASDNYTPGEKDLLRFNLKRVEEAIPFTQKQVTDAVRAGESTKLNADQKKMSFTEFSQIKFPTEEKSTLQIDPRAIAELKENPDALRDAFDETFGAGSADRILGRK